MGTNLLEATGKLYSDGAGVYVKSMSREDFQSHAQAVGLDSDWYGFSDNSPQVSLENLFFEGPRQHLYEYLRESGWLTPLEVS